MADIAELGYRIDSRQALTAERNLNRMGSATQGVTRVLGAFAVAVGAAFSFNAAISQARRLDAAIGELSTLIPGATQQLNDMTEATRALGVAFGTGSQAQASAFYAAVSAGATNSAEAIARVDAANRLAIGGVASLSSSIAILNTATNAYAASNLSAADAADVLFTGVRTGVTTIPELSAALGRAIPAAVAVGVEFDELVGAVSALTTQGQSTNIAVTSLTAALSQLTNPSQQAREIAQRLGIQFNATAVETMGLVGFMENLVDATDGNRETMAQLFGSVEALRAVFSLAGQGGVRFAGIMEQMDTRAGAADEAFETMSARLSQRWNVIMSTASARAEDLGGALLSVMVPAAEESIKVFTDAEDSSLALEVAFKAVAVTAGVLLVRSLAVAATSMFVASGAAGTLATAFQLMTVQGGAAIVTTQALGAAVRFALGPVGLMITAVGALTLAWAAHKTAAQAIRDQYSDLFDSLSDIDRLQQGATTQSLSRARALLAEAEATQTATDAESARALAIERSNVARAQALFDASTVDGRGSANRAVAARALAEAQARLVELDEQQFVRRLELAGATEELRAQVASLFAAEQARDRARRAAANDNTETDAVRETLATLRQTLAVTSQETELRREIATALLQAGLSLDDQSEMAQRIRETVTQIYNIEQSRAAAIDAENEALREQERLLREQEANRSRVGGELGTLTGTLDKEFTDPLEALRLEMEGRRAILQEALELELITREDYQTRAAQIETSYSRARNEMMLAAGESMFGELTDLMRQTAGEQSGIYKAMFAVEKAFALAQAVIFAHAAITKAAASAAPPLNIPAIAMASAQTLPQVAMIAAQTVQGLHSGGSVFVGGAGGIDNNMMSINGQPVARVERGERVDVVPRSAQSSNDNAPAPVVNFQPRLVNATGVPLQVDWITKDEARIMIAQDAPGATARSLQDPSSEMSGTLTSVTNARRVR